MFLFSFFFFFFPLPFFISPSSTICQLDASEVNDAVRRQGRNGGHKKRKEKKRKTHEIRRPPHPLHSPCPGNRSVWDCDEWLTREKTEKDGEKKYEVGGKTDIFFAVL
eukprot:TRINITY_DN3187_c0_g1_i1.p2 TRINITY_DN3187_c0_g1~~TRINITY_DN3187_c0_g1_i1.p2  ORF type:complete len:108 (-),score=4.75 TRINITY_DN3187_c0_g1_i1:144-467(-)